MNRVISIKKNSNLKMFLIFNNKLKKKKKKKKKNLFLIKYKKIKKIFYFKILYHLCNKCM